MDKKLLTREDLLRGTNKTEKVYIESLGGEVEIRPLNEEQWAEIEAKSSDAYDIGVEPVYKNVNGKKVYDDEETQKNMKIKFNVEKGKRAEFEQCVLAVKYGLVMEITENEIRSITPPGIIKKIADEIFRISDVDKEKLEEIKSFRRK